MLCAPSGFGGGHSGLSLVLGGVVTFPSVVVVVVLAQVSLVGHSRAKCPCP